MVWKENIFMSVEKAGMAQNNEKPLVFIAALKLE